MKKLGSDEINNCTIELNAVRGQKRKQIALLIFGLGCVFFVIPLLFHIYAGSFMRPSGDDYCYGATQVKYGFWGAQWYAYQHIGQLYNGNRYSQNLSLAIFGLFPPKADAVASGAAIILWLSCIVFFLYQVNKFLKRPMHIIEMLFLGLPIIFFVFYISPDVTQILYWYTGMSNYVLPIIFNIFLFGIIFLAARRFIPILHIPLILIVAFIAGGFSETTAVMQFCFIMILIIWVVLINRNKKSTVLLLPVMIACIATIASILLLAFSPATGIRFGTGNHPTLVTVITLTIKYSIDFFYTTIKGIPLPLSLIFLLGLLYSYMRKFTHELPNEKARSVYNVGWIALGCFLLVAASFSPSVYAQSAYPGERAILPARFVLTSSLIWIGFCVGSIIPRPKTTSKMNTQLLVYVIGVLFVFALGAYALRATKPIAAQIPKFQKWAYFWDLRDQTMRTDKQNGVLNVHVVLIDHLIYDVGDLSPDPYNWYNQCASADYGLQSITADLPGWDQ
jgi:hypothetical protein